MAFGIFLFCILSSFDQRIISYISGLKNYISKNSYPLNMQEIKKSLRDSKSARWLMLILVSFTMMCMYYLTDAMAPLQERLQGALSWSASDYGFFTSGYGWFNVFLLMLVFSGMILDKMGVRFTGILAIGIMLIGATIKYWAISGHVTGMYELHIGSWQVLESSRKSAVVARIWIRDIRGWLRNVWNSSKQGGCALVPRKRNGACHWIKHFYRSYRNCPGHVHTNTFG